MDNVTNVINRLLQILIELGNLIIGGIVTLEVWLRGQLGQFGMSAQVQTVIMLALAALLVVGALRIFGGLIRVAIVLVLILIAIHIVLPVMPH